jgi:hypothetical protein
MTCPSCGTTNPAGVEFCEVCGAPLAPRATPAADAPDPGRKRRTLYDPGPARNDPAPDDVFVNPPPPRPNFDAADPFRGSLRPAAPPPAPPPTPAPAETRNRTVYDAPPTAAPAQGLRGVLVVTGASLRLVPLGPGRTSLGRDADNDVVLEDSKVSGTHGFLYLKDDGASFIDVSRNGSVVDGEPILGEPRPLRHGSVLGLGGARCVILLVPDDAATALLG